MESWILLLGFLQVASCLDSFHYDIHGDEVSFEEAKMNCRHEGVLTTLYTREEVLAVKQAVAQHLESSGEYTYWIGLWRPKPVCLDPKAKLKGFKWMDGGHEAEDIKWKGSPQQTCTHDRCVYISVIYDGTSVVDWGLMDDSCKKKRPFICKVAGKKKIPAPKDCEIPTIKGIPTIEGTDEHIHRAGNPSKLVVVCKNKKSYNLTCASETQKWTTMDGSTVDLLSICVPCSVGFEKSHSGQCVDIDECKNQPCGPNIECENSEGSFHCKGLTTQPPNDPHTQPTQANAEVPFINPDQNSTVDPRSVLVDVEEARLDYYIYIPVIIAVLALLLLLVVILTIVACCRRRKRKRSKNLAGKKASKETMALRDSMEKINEK